jgi:hypothetical protein
MQPSACADEFLVVEVSLCNGCANILHNYLPLGLGYIRTRFESVTRTPSCLNLLHSPFVPSCQSVQGPFYRRYLHRPLAPHSEAKFAASFHQRGHREWHEREVSHIAIPSFASWLIGGYRQNWQDLFGILFPATAGIFAGASMSGDLKDPSKSIPKGTLYGLLFTFVLYTLVILSMGASIARQTLYTNFNVIQSVCSPLFGLLSLSSHVLGQYLSSYRPHGRVCDVVFLRINGCYWIRQIPPGACQR